MELARPSLPTEQPLTPPMTDRARKAIGKAAYDFYRCLRCRRLITQPEMIRALGPTGGCACPCGGVKYSPTNLPWYGWFLPRVIAFAAERAVDLGWTGIKANFRADLAQWPDRVPLLRRRRG